MAMPNVSMDYSPVAIFLQADPVVKSVVIALLLTSVVSWAVMLARFFAVWRERRSSGELLARVSNSSEPDAFGSLAQETQCAGAVVLGAVMDEWAWSRANGLSEYANMRERMRSVANLAIGREAALLGGATSLLATIGSVSPFVGLFGTVWGIMHSFISIGQTQDTSLAVVAPGIAEALMATAVGLFCAIPAVIGYNRIVARLGRVAQLWRDIATMAEVYASRRFEHERG